MFRRLSIAFAALCTVAASASAETVHFQFSSAGAGYNANGVYIGTYTGVQDFGGANLAVGLNCVDYFHEVTFGQQWDANLSYLGSGDVSLTRHADGLEKYKEAAWLISQYTPQNVLAVQSTIWNLFQPTGGAWVSDPDLLAAAQAPHPDFDYSHYYIVTDVNANGVNDASSAQEFMIYDPTIISTDETEVTPEPSTVVLMASGLGGIALFRIRRKKTA